MKRPEHVVWDYHVTTRLGADHADVTVAFDFNAPVDTEVVIEKYGRCPHRKERSVRMEHLILRSATRCSGIRKSVSVYTDHPTKAETIVDHIGLRQIEVRDKCVYF